jgi:hypothetical protein
MSWQPPPRFATCFAVHRETPVILAFSLWNPAVRWLGRLPAAGHPALSTDSKRIANRPTRRFLYCLTMGTISCRIAKDHLQPQETVMEVKGIEIEFVPHVLLWLSTETELDERELKQRFRAGAFANAYTTQNGLPHMKYAVLWDDKKEKPYLFKCRLADPAKPWQVREAMTTCTDHEAAWNVSIKGHHLVQARDNCIRYLHKLSFKLFIQVSPPVGPIRDVELANVRLNALGEFAGSGADFLRCYVKPEKLEAMSSIDIPEGSRLCLHVRAFGKNHRVIRSFPL